MGPNCLPWLLSAKWLLLARLGRTERGRFGLISGWSGKQVAILRELSAVVKAEDTGGQEAELLIVLQGSSCLTPSMAPQAGAEARGPVGLCLGCKCHITHLTPVLTLLASVLLAWLEAARVLMGFQAPWNITHPFSVQRLGAGLQIALDKINSEPGNISWEFTYTNSTCSTKESLAIFIKQVQQEQISALFGPACPEVLEVEYPVF